MIIACPHCQTKYQVTYEAIGSAGRKVQCAHCQKAWDQPPIDKEEPPPEIRQAEQAVDEDGLDDAMSAQDSGAADKAARVAGEKAAKVAKESATKEAKSKKAGGKNKGKTASSPAGKIDRSVIRKRRQAFKRPGDTVVDEQPLERLRLALRIIGATALVGVLVFAYLGRVQVVQRFPAMAGVYAALGMGINVVGLEFSDVTAMQTLRNGKEVLIVSAQIVGLSPTLVAVPAVVVTLIAPNGQGVYQWSVQPTVRDLMAGERSTFDTQLTLPPGEASRVRLSFAGGSSFRASTSQPTAGEAGDGHGGTPTEVAAPDHAAPAHEVAKAPVEAGHETPAPAGHDGAASPEHGASATPEPAPSEHH